MAQTKNNSGEARHICRYADCSYVAQPGPRAHKKLARHLLDFHGSRAITKACATECGYRARPAEGRYTEQTGLHSHGPVTHAHQPTTHYVGEDGKWVASEIHGGPVEVESGPNQTVGMTLEEWDRQYGLTPEQLARIAAGRSIDSVLQLG